MLKVLVQVQVQVELQKAEPDLEGVFGTLKDRLDSLLLVVLGDNSLNLIVAAETSLREQVDQLEEGEVVLDESLIDPLLHLAWVFSEFCNLRDEGQEVCISALLEIHADFDLTATLPAQEHEELVSNALTRFDQDPDDVRLIALDGRVLAGTEGREKFEQPRGLIAPLAANDELLYDFSGKLVLEDGFVLVREQGQEGVGADLVVLTRIKHISQVEIDPLSRVDLVQTVVLNYFGEQYVSQLANARNRRLLRDLLKVEGLFREWNVQDLDA